MRNYVCLCALVVLPACLGSGGGDDVDAAVVADTSMNTSFGSIMNQARLNNNGSATQLQYNETVARVAGIHAVDMVENNYLSATIPGTDNGSGQLRDIGDRLNDAGYRWIDLEQLVAQGDFTTQEAYQEFEGSDGCGPATVCTLQEGFSDFGIAKAGTGSGQKWVFIMTEPQP